MVTPGQVSVTWDMTGEIDVRTTLSVCSADNKKLLVRVLLDAAKAVNDAGTALELAPALPARIMAG